MRRSLTIFMIYVVIAFPATWYIDGLLGSLLPTTRGIVGVAIGVVGISLSLATEQALRARSPADRNKGFPPTPPTNVRVELVDGRVIPIDCHYVGFDGREHRWANVQVVNAPISRVLCDEIPPDTCILVSGRWTQEL